MATTNLALELQNQGAADWHTENNNNFQKIDNFLTLKRCRVYADAVQVITTNTFTPITFAVETYDTDNMHDNVTNNSRITIATAGFYIIKGQLMYDVAAGGRRTAYLRRNNLAMMAQTEGAAAADAVAMPTLIVTTDYYLNAGDYIELFAHHTKGTNQNTYAVSTSTSYLMVVRVGF